MSTLSMIYHHNKHMKNTPYDVEPKSLRITDDKMFKGIKKQIEWCFELIDDGNPRHEYGGQFITLGDKGFSSFSMKTLNWTPI
ncbi:hypothetical protein SAMD00019534_074970 [Acytostelium subglobosum LB1]|uniref:hypothetical protein n=1 Tax=Acytostelium subglobosum LB1 TaxID=1410327 RepID=UPI000644FCC9|nr:hypothetical protein SAMD00019534_074970 [Acytostelium subglobosum LB1]GAM24322.1 hypothetical protein SAMD00019534_074970 [Acytostelium subglobosum LB1]|eukprot:XP_012752648.1 hypothetical protein SAMD00019534_074970 [Acytostelium subglobosum LB1]